MGSKKKGSKGKNWKNQIRMEEPIDKSLTKDQLKAELKKRGLRTSGTKNELLQRLEKKNNSASSSNVATGSNTQQPQNSGMPGVSRRSKLDISTTSGMAGQQHSNGNTPPGKRAASEAVLREKERKERAKLVVWRHPVGTLYYALLEAIHLTKTSLSKMLQHRVLMTILTFLISACLLLVNLKGPHQKVVQPIIKQAWWCTYWVGLGVLSSVGLGTGLHTFLLYLGPHIASVTLAAYECESLDFPSPPYPDEIVCPENVGSNTLWQGSASVWSAVFAIMAKVRVEAFMWGAGTALGELPPYFMARAARLSGIDPEDEEDELRDFEELQRKRLNHEHMTLYERAKLKVEQLVERVGFFGILACASIPNPLFDLAGITCGHFLVPFWTFFGATLIGKAIIKMHIQKLFVIIAFNEPLLEKAVLLLGYLPGVGPRLQEPFKEFLVRQKHKLHRKAGSSSTGDAKEGSMLASLFEKFVIAMVMYFVVSIVNSLAQSYHKRLHKRARGDPAKLARD